MIAAKHEPPAEGSNDPHTVVHSRGGRAVVHGIAGPSVRPVLEAGRKLDQLEACRFIPHWSNGSISMWVCGKRFAGFAVKSSSHSGRADQRRTAAHKCAPVHTI